jgi:hypothetical protein
MVMGNKSSDGLFETFEKDFANAVVWPPLILLPRPRHVTPSLPHARFKGLVCLCANSGRSRQSTN